VVSLNLAHPVCRARDILSPVRLSVTSVDQSKPLVVKKTIYIYERMQFSPYSSRITLVFAG